MKTSSLSRALWAILAIAALLFTACPTGSDDNGVSKEPSNVSYTVTFNAGAGTDTPPEW